MRQAQKRLPRDNETIGVERGRGKKLLLVSTPIPSSTPLVNQADQLSLDLSQNSSTADVEEPQGPVVAPIVAPHPPPGLPPSCTTEVDTTGGPVIPDDVSDMSATTPDLEPK